MILRMPELTWREIRKHLDFDNRQDDTMRKAGLYIILLIALDALVVQQAYSWTSKETKVKKGPWIVLFDGSDVEAWRSYKGDVVAPQWKVENGELRLTGKGGGDLMTREQFENFELEMEWKISEGGNSGVFFNVVEADTLKRVYHSGPEIQIVDNDRHPDAKIPTHRAGDNYDLQACSEETVKPAGSWNTMRIIVDKGHVEHYLNGTKVVEYDLWTPKWEEQVQRSKFSKFPAYGKAKKGHIALQDHGDPVYFRNIRIRRL